MESQSSVNLLTATLLMSISATSQLRRFITLNCNRGLAVFSCRKHYENKRTKNHKTKRNSTVDGLHEALQCCTDIESLGQCHSQIFVNGLHNDVVLITKLVGMYAAYGFMEDAWQTFVAMREKHDDLFLWNVMMRACVIQGFNRRAVELYNELRQRQESFMQIDNYSFSFALKACAELGLLQMGRIIHGHAVAFGFQSDVFVVNSLVGMYAKCAQIQPARKLFDELSEKDVVSWNSIIVGYLQHEDAASALRVFNNMRNSDVVPDYITIMSVLQGCAALGLVDLGRFLHGFVVQMGFENSLQVINSLIAMYSKCGDPESALQLFDNVPQRDVVSWNAIIAGYVQNGNCRESLEFYLRMQEANVNPSLPTIVTLVQASAHLTALKVGSGIHGYAVRRGFGEDLVLKTALVDMYTKCGSVDTARRVFDRMHHRNVVSWNAMIAGYGMHGHGRDALQLFKQMEQTPEKPNDITFMSVLNACSHACMPDEGLLYFKSMTEEYCITPRMEHYVCMVDLLGRSGRLQEAYDFVCRMPLQPDNRVLAALLSACRSHGNSELADKVADCLLSFKSHDS